jgi:hypothetical protein
VAIGIATAAIIPIVAIGGTIVMMAAAITTIFTAHHRVTNYLAFVTSQ